LLYTREKRSVYYRAVRGIQYIRRGAFGPFVIYRICPGRLSLNSPIHPNLYMCIRIPDVYCVRFVVACRVLSLFFFRRRYFMYFWRQKKKRTTFMHTRVIFEKSKKAFTFRIFFFFIRRIELRSSYNSFRRFYKFKLLESRFPQQYPREYLQFSCRVRLEYKYRVGWLDPM